MPIEMTERLERALKLWSFDARGDALDAFQQELIAAYREARDAASEGQGEAPEPFRETEKRMKWEPHETPLTIERLVRVLRGIAEVRVDPLWDVLADALEAEEE